MAAIIDGSTYKGFWKITPDDASPNTYRLSEKNAGIYLTVSDSTSGELVLGGIAGSSIALTFSSCEDENGNALDTSAKIAQYLSDNR